MDFIPLISGKSLDRQNKSNKSNKLNDSRKNQQKRGASEQAILQTRMKQYLKGCKYPKHVDIWAIVDGLRASHLEYRRKKRNVFKVAVTKAYATVRQDPDLNQEEISASSEESEASSGIHLVEYQDTNAVNNSLRDMYQPLAEPTQPQDNRQSHGKLPEMDPKKVTSKRKSSTANAKNIAQDKSNQSSKEIEPTRSTVKFADVGGNEACIEEVCKMLVHLKHPEVYQQIGVPPPRGLLLHGPPGCGKTLLAHAIAGELDLPFIKIAATEIVSGVSGESEEKIRTLFGQAMASAPCVLFLDEIDAITPKRETAQREMERRIVAQLLTSMDGLNQDNQSAAVLVIGATNRPDALDPALRRAGRFDREISMGIPDAPTRIRILKVLCRKLRLAPGFEFNAIADITPGYVGADLMAVVREAAMNAVNRIFEKFHTLWQPNTGNDLQSSNSDANPVVQSRLDIVLQWLHGQTSLTPQQLQDLFVEMPDFQEAIKIVQPSSKREGFVTVPDVTWSDIGALHDIREELQLSILAPVRHPEQFKSLGLVNPAGILLCGPPGCGKTLLAKAIANESGVNFISVKGPELLNMYLGESERAVRQCFQRARNSAPCVIFFDELDALCPRRTDSAEGGTSARVVNQLLTEMDGMDSRRSVFILGATNRLDIIDSAVLRPGRLDKVIYVGIPTDVDRVDILNALTKGGTKPVLEEDVSVTSIASDKRCTGFTGADLSSLVREASMAALKESMTTPDKTASVQVGKRHFENAFRKVKSSVSAKDQKMYERLKMACMPTATDVHSEPMQTESES